MAIKRRSPPEDLPPEDELDPTEGDPSDAPPTPAWTAPAVNPVSEEEKRMTTSPPSDVANGNPQPMFDAAQQPTPVGLGQPYVEPPHDLMAPPRTAREQALREYRQAGETVQALISQAHNVVTSTAHAKVQLNQATLFSQGDGQNPANTQWLSWFFTSPAQDQLTLVALHGSRLNLSLAYKVAEAMGVELPRLDTTADITGGAQLRERILGQIARSTDGQPSPTPKSVGSLDQAYQLEAHGKASE